MRTTTRSELSMSLSHHDLPDEQPQLPLDDVVDNRWRTGLALLGLAVRRGLYATAGGWIIQGGPVDYNGLMLAVFAGNIWFSSTIAWSRRTRPARSSKSSPLVPEIVSISGHDSVCHAVCPPTRPPIKQVAPPLFSLVSPVRSLPRLPAVSPLSCAQGVYAMRNDAFSSPESGLDDETEAALAQLDPQTRARLQRLMAKASSEPQSAVVNPSAKVVYLPERAAAKRGVPHAALRSSLFAAVQGKHRRYMTRELLATPERLEIRFTGIQLDQSDLDVWELLLHLAWLHPLGTRCQFQAKPLLKELGRSTGKKDREWLKDSVARLGGCFVEVTYGRWTYGGSLLELYRDEETGRYVLELNPKLINLFHAGWTAMDRGRRRQLRRKPLALWLYGYLASHAAPFPVTVEYLHRLSGSNTKSMRKFKQNLVAALQNLQDLGIIRSFEIIGNIVHVKTVLSPSQRRSLSQAKSRQR